MKKTLLFAAIFASVFSAIPEANAVVCARGVVRAGCVAAAPRGAAVVRAPVARRPVGAVRVVR
jgi:hypothetical protein